MIVSTGDLAEVLDISASSVVCSTLSRGCETVPP